MFWLTIFWLTVVATAVAAAVLLTGVLCRRSDDAQASDAEADMAIYRDQLAEVRRDEARGLLGAAEAERLRLEVSRRLLEADRKAARTGRPGVAPTWANLAAAAVVALLVVGGSLGLYTWLGSPGLRDRPVAERVAEAEAARASRTSQQMAEAEAALRLTPSDADAQFLRLMEQLRAAVEENPDDLEGLKLLAENEARLGNFAAARRAQARLIELRGAAAGLDDWERYAELLIQAAGGYVSPEAERALGEVLRRDPDSRLGLFYMGLLHAETGRPDWAFRLWRPLLDGPPTDAPWMRFVEDNIAAVAALAGEEFMPPAPRRGPSEAEIAAAGEMSPEEQQQMVRGMIEGLSNRLAAQGGPAEDWAQLIVALGVLGETDRADAIYSEAQEIFGQAAEDLALIESAAARAGLVQ